MLAIHVYGFLKKKFDPEAKLSESTVLKIKFNEHETFTDLLKRLNIDESELGDCFINGHIAEKNIMIPNDARIGLFGFGMRLLDGGQHIKGHGYITRQPPLPLNTWNP